jgi:carbamoyltransferase
MNVLGLNFFSHGAAACIVVNGGVVAAAEEERFNRQKHSKNFPQLSIEFCLRTANLSIDQIDLIAVFVDPSSQYKLGLVNLYQAFPRSLLFLPYAYQKTIKRNLMIQEIGKYLGREAQKKVVYVNHHIAHAASSFYSSPFENATLLTIDGRGEFETVCISRGQGTTIEKIESTFYPFSVGYLYSMVTKYLGFRPQSEEYIVMGLASYGKDTFCHKFQGIAYCDEKGFKLNLNYFDHHYRYGKNRKYFSEDFVRLFGPARCEDEPITQRHADIAYAVQKLAEEIITKLVTHAYTLVPQQNLCLAGGVALNCVANKVIGELGLFQDIFIQPAADDAGTCLGAALYSSARVSQTRTVNTSFSPYLGPGFDREQIREAITAQLGQELQVIFHKDICAQAARMLYNGMVIGWFQGRMEFGPRALGNRSILASPTDATTKQKINDKVKFREDFRPFAPAVKAEKADTFFVLDEHCRLLYPFMLATVQARLEYADYIPAVLHIDNSARVQSVTKQANPLFWNLLNSFEQLSGLPVILNTSLNIKGEPIACTPTDAIKTFLNSGLDALVIDHFVITRRESNV